MLTWLLLGLGLALVAFAAVWAICVKVRNYSFLDVAWSYGVLVLAPIYALVGPGHLERKIAYTVLGCAWSARLGTYILRRVLRHHPKEDVRYEALRKSWPGPGMFFLFFELQAAIAVLFSVPFLFAAWMPRPLEIIDFIGLGIALLALLGEALADFQMTRFKTDPENRERVCQAGLWRYSRHPNYFFEFLFWIGIAVASLNAPHAWVAWLCPLLMYYFLTRVTGIPLTEEFAVKSKGDAYRAYQRTTSAFVPWFRRET